MTLIAKEYTEQTPSPDELVATHMNLVRKVAWQMHGRVGRMIEIEDLLQVGYIGLVDASQRYIPKPGVNFAAYAKIRIRGSIVDYLRANASMCRASIAMHQKVKVATSQLEQELHRSPTGPELAERLEISILELHGWQSQFATQQPKSLDEVYSDHSDLFKDNSASAEDLYQQDELKGLLRVALEGLPEREALVLQLYYVEELNIYEIAEILSVTTGRVSQIKKSAVERLRKGIAERQGEAA
ncbi:sigma-70 family RNA polymerase sigma factor [Thioclava sp. FR2]|uniref:sigma-70 family RNA polymerase sigma factor n=1 Tax=Thioclava sp. FR2 TaxID=3445780 RepID=UPI003EBC3A64